MVSKKVLIVDDEFSIRDMLRMALEIADFECLEAENIQDAHRLIVAQMFHLMRLMDIERSSTYQ